MQIFISFITNAYYILGSTIIVFFAMKYALEQMNSGLDLIKAVSRMLGFIVFFLALVFVLPALFEFGTNKTISRMQNSTTSKNIIALVEDGSKLLAQESVNLSRVEVDESSLANEAQELYDDVQSNVQSNSKSDVSSEHAASQTSVQMAPQSNVIAAPVQKPLVLAPEYLTATPKPLVLFDAANTPTSIPLVLIEAQNTPTPVPLMLLEAADDGGGGPQTYTVQAGDSLFKIANKFGVTVAALCQANNLRDCNIVAKGKKLVIP
ncbi:MAG TPA: LysM peptidoglycan-binding domain-containing protein [Caldilineaceae bacterium]|nr:LysM peptidoglycan-binding domain-containing protein [Caldilineaceae bacterium]